MARRFDHLLELEAFQLSAENGSFTAAAHQLASTPSAVSRAVGRLEAKLGVQLLQRSTRSLSLTEAGALYLEQSRAAFALIEDAERAIQGRDAVTGRVRVSVPTTWGHHRGAARFAAFRLRYPDVKLEIGISNRNVDLVAEGYDAAVRLGELPDSGLIARPLEQAALCLVASPAYLQRKGIPASVDALRDHDCIPFVMPSTGRVLPWSLRVDGNDLEWSAAADLVVADDVLGCVALAESGAGITQSYDFVVAERIANGRLVELLPQTRGRMRAFSLIYAPHRRMSRVTRVLIDFLTSQADPAVIGS